MIARAAGSGLATVEKITELTLVLLLGSLLTWGGLAPPGFAGWFLVPLLLVAIRPLATVAAFARSSVPLRERAFVGWLGIRGIGVPPLRRRGDPGRRPGGVRGDRGSSGASPS